jgi:hypothetical protein
MQSFVLAACDSAHFCHFLSPFGLCHPIPTLHRGLTNILYNFKCVLVYVILPECKLFYLNYEYLSLIALFYLSVWGS